MATPSCSHWWHCPVYLAMSITLAAIAISSVKHSPSLSLSSNASLALRSHNFTSFATLLQSNPQLLLSPQSTFFAIPDNPLSKFHSRPLFLKQLLKYHSVPTKIPFNVLKNKPQGTCFDTLDGKNLIGITKIGNELLEINHVVLTHPDLFLAGAVAIHGVSGPFASDENTKLPCCGNRMGFSQWRDAVRFLSSKGYVSFGVGLSSVLEGVIRENPDLGLATVFAPVDFGFISSSWGLLGEIVRYHIVPERFVYGDLGSFPDNLVLKTLHLDRKLVINVTGVGGKLRINGVEIIARNAYLSEKIAIHGISRAFPLEELPSTSL